MALINSLFSGVSGLKNHQEMMDVIGNNISNVNTVGYKSSRVTFSDTFNQLVKSGTNPTDTSGGTNTFQVGLGTKISSIDRNWAQGTFEQSDNTTDLAIKGSGLFILKSNGTNYYSRAGAFNFDSDGKLVSSQNGAIVQGKVANGLGEIPAGTTTQDIIVDKNLKLPAVKTTKASWSGNLQSSSTTQRTDIVALSGNLESSTGAAITYPATDATNTIYGTDGAAYTLSTHYTKAAGANTWTANYTMTDSAVPPANVPLSSSSQTVTFDASGNVTSPEVTVTGGTANFKLNLSSLTNTSATSNTAVKVDKGETPKNVEGAVTIYDSLGNSHTLSLTFKHIDSNKWSWSASIPAEDGTLNGTNSGELSFNTDGTIASITQGGVTVTSPSISFTPTSGAEGQDISLDFGSDTSGVTQTSLSSQISALSQNGSASATLSNMSIDQYGNVVGIFSNGNSRTLAQIMVANFANENGLVSIGDNLYQVAANSGAAQVDEPGERSNTVIQSGSLEQSNVDLSEELTKMIIAQRGFQANSRVITTSDTLLQEITNLVR